MTGNATTYTTTVAAHLAARPFVLGFEDGLHGRPFAPAYERSAASVQGLYEDGRLFAVFTLARGAFFPLVQGETVTAAAKMFYVRAVIDGDIPGQMVRA